MKILLACRAINGTAGGMERQAILLMNEMVARGHEVHFLTFDLSSATSFYPMDPTVTWHRLDMGDPQKRASWGLRIKRAFTVRRMVQDLQPDIILGFQQGMFLGMRLYTAGLGIPVIASERESPARYDFIRDGKRRNFFFQTYRLATKITVQCDSYKDAYPAYLRDKITVIPNPVRDASVYADPAKDTPRKTLLYIARLGYSKNPCVLVEAFGKLAQDFPDWQLRMAGEGEERANLKSCIQTLDLQDRVTLLGAQRDVSSLYQSAHLFCLPSRWEGFPNALAEAMAHGLPSVGFAGCDGVRDLIKDGKNGILAAGNGDVQALSETLRSLMLDPEKRRTLGKRAIETVAPYVPEKIFDRWESFLTDIVTKKDQNNI